MNTGKRKSQLNLSLIMMHLRAPSRLEEPLLKGLFRAENKQHNPQPLAPLWEPNNPLFETLNDELDRALEVTKLKKKQRP